MDYDNDVGRVKGSVCRQQQSSPLLGTNLYDFIGLHLFTFVGLWYKCLKYTTINETDELELELNYIGYLLFSRK